MDKLLLKEIVLEQKSMQEDIDPGIPRDQLSEVKKYKSMPHVIVVSGIRRVGKSTLLSQIIKEYYSPGIYYFNFEDERLLNFKVEDFNSLYEIFIEFFNERKVFFFDEVQNIAGWEVFVRRMQDKGMKFYITGSNASLLSKELGTKLTGRNLIVELFPFSFKEYLKYIGVNLSSEDLYYTARRARIKRCFYDFLAQGGMPEYHKYKDITLLKRVYEDILYRDVVARYDIKDVKALRELGLYFLNNVSGTFSYNNLKTVLRLGSENTVKKYTGFLEDSYLIFTVPRYTESLRQQFYFPRKVYCVDNGIIASVSHHINRNKKAFLENLVFIELKRRYDGIYYYKTRDDMTVDFVVKKEKGPACLIQVRESLNAKDKEREAGILSRAMKDLKIKDAVILTEDQEEKVEREGKEIKIVPVYKWLLE